MHANKMKIVIFIIAAVQIFYCSAQTCGVMAPPQAELVLNAAITKVNEEYAINNIFAVRLCEVVNFIPLTNGFALLDITISVQETECDKNSTLDLAQCPLKPISDAETANCTGQVLTEEDKVRSIIIQCTNTTSATKPNASTATPTTGSALSTSRTSPNASTATPTTGSTLGTSSISPNASTATPKPMGSVLGISDISPNASAATLTTTGSALSTSSTSPNASAATPKTTGSALSTSSTSPNASAATPVTRQASTVNAPSTKKTTITIRNRSSSSSESSESSKRCSRRFGWTRYLHCKRRNGWRTGKRRSWRSDYRRQLNLSQITPLWSTYATTTPYKAE